MNIITRLLRKNTSPARIAGFILSNFIGIMIVAGALQFYIDAGSIWSDSDSFIRSDYLVINKKVTSANTLGKGDSGFSEEEIADLERQPWVRETGKFRANDYRVLAGVRQGDRGMSTYMFFESIPDRFIDVPGSHWQWREGMQEVPVILSKDYLTLYNFGFAASAGLPQLSEGLMSSIPLELKLTSEDGTRTMRFNGRIAGFSNRLNTILVPDAFMTFTNSRLGSGERAPSRLIVDVSSPGDVAITRYLENHDYEVAGDKSASSASFLLKVIVGIVMAVGVLITLLSFFILMLSISLIMEKNRDKLHSLLMLGYDARTVGRPYGLLVVWSSVAAGVLAVAGVLLLRLSYIDALEGLGAHPGSLLPMLTAAVVLTALIIGFNLLTVRKRTIAAWR